MNKIRHHRHKSSKGAVSRTKVLRAPSPLRLVLKAYQGLFVALILLYFLKGA